MWQNPVSRRSQPPCNWHQCCFHRNQHPPSGRGEDTVPGYARLPGRWHARSWLGADRNEVWRWDGESWILSQLHTEESVKENVQRSTFSPKVLHERKTNLVLCYIYYIYYTQNNETGYLNLRDVSFSVFDHYYNLKHLVLIQATKSANVKKNDKNRKLKYSQWNNSMLQIWKQQKFEFSISFFKSDDRDFDFECFQSMWWQQWVSVFFYLIKEISF